MDGRARKASGCSAPCEGRPQRPLTAPAATGSRPEGHEDERGHAQQLTPAELATREVVLEGRDAQTDAGGHGQGGGGQHHRLRRGEAAQVAPGGGQGQPPAAQGQDPEASGPDDAQAAADRERQGGGQHDAPDQGGAGHRADGEAEHLAPVGSGGAGEGQPEDLHGALPGQRRAHDPGRQQYQRDDDALGGDHEDTPARLTHPDDEGTEGPGHGGSQDHGLDGGGERGGEGDDRAEGGDLSGRARPPVWTRFDRERRDAGRLGQAQGDEGEQRVGDQPVPTARAQRAVGQGEPEVADDRDHTRPRRDEGTHEAGHAPGADGDAARAAGRAGACPWRRTARCR